MSIPLTSQGQDYRDFMKIVTKEFRIPQEYQDASEIYICRRWTASEISGKLGCDGIKISKFYFQPVFSQKATLLYNEELSRPDPDDKPKYFWLSFRAIRYPLGSKNPDDEVKAYVVIQPDLRS